jgi:hypothetical protein
MSDELATAEDELVAELVGDSPEPVATDSPADAIGTVANESHPSVSSDESNGEVAADDAADTHDVESAEINSEADDAEPAAEPAVPFSVTVYGQQHAIPGLTWDQKAQALRVADERAFHRVQNLLTKGREWETRGRQELHQTRRQLETVQQTKSETEAQASAYLAEWQKVLSLPEQDFLAFAQAFRQNVPRLEAQAERAAAEQVLAQARQLQEPPEPDPETIIEQAQDGSAELVAQMVRGQPWADPTVTQELARLMQSPSVLGQFVYRAQEDVPQYGVRRGQWVADWDAARQLVVQYAQPYQRAHALAERKVAEATQRATATAPVAQQNARVLAKAGAVPAPTTRAPNGSRTTPDKAPATTPADLDRELDAMWADMIRTR